MLLEVLAFLFSLSGVYAGVFLFVLVHVLLWGAGDGAGAFLRD